MINIRKLKTGDLVRALEDNDKMLIKKGDVYRVISRGHTFGEYWADIRGVQNRRSTSISTGFDDYKWEKI